jgi:tetratricopeptide (TPR) repeat protein/anti-sigma regulatory factor (Ser/Thr protein kinase)
MVLFTKKLFFQSNLYFMKNRSKITKTLFALFVMAAILRGPISYSQTDSVHAWVTQSELAVQKDNLSEGVKWAKKAFEQAQTEGVPAKIGEASRQLGEVYRMEASLDKAEEMLTLAVRTYEKMGNPVLNARSLAELARIKQGQRDFEKAIELYTNALAIYNQKLTLSESEKNLDLNGFILERMAVVNSSLKQYDKAENYALEAIRIFERISDKGRLEVASTSLGNVYFWKTNYEKADFYYQKAYEISKSTGRNTGRNLNNLGIIASRRNQPDKAIEYFLGALEQYKKLGSKELIAQTQVNIGDMYNKNGNFLKAIEMTQQGTDGLLAIKKISGLLEGYETLINAFIKAGEQQKAIEYQKRFIDLKDSLSNNSRQNALLELQNKFENEKKNKEITLLNQENAYRDLQIKQSQLDLTNQKLLTEKNEKAIALLRQTKQLQESELALAMADLDHATQISNTKNIQLTVYQQSIKAKEQEALVQTKNNELLRGAILTLLLLGFIFWQSFKYRQKIKKEREHVAQLRAEEAAQRHWQETELRALRSQMNPHFIFNCLNAIKSLTLKNETDKASLYITKFSRLMRQVLENSRSEWISLNQELETLSLYMDMEKLRFQTKFNYQLNVSPDLSTHSIQVPPMLIQPYVENAIWHGLMHKEGNGEVVVSLESEDDKQLIIKIIDDGIGRKRSTELKSKTATEKKSFGMQITSERMDMLNQYYHINATSTIKDLYDTLGNPIGTEVCLVIPI